MSYKKAGSSISIIPGVPHWIAKIFPTYSMLKPIVELMNNAAWSDIAIDVFILIGLTIVLIRVSGFLSLHALDA